MPLLPADVLLAELARRAELERGDPAANPERGMRALLDGLHPKQAAFVRDDSRQKAALCSRRAGKSWGIGAWLLAGGFEDPGGLSVYIARSKGDARLILWPDVLETMNATHKLGLRLREIDNQLMVELPNRHRIWLAGCKDQSEIGKFRGKKYKRACVDEAQELPFLRELITASLQPALIDKRGALCVTGTPSPIPAGFFYSATTGDGGGLWPTHHWTILDNPHIPHASEEIASMMATYGWDETNPTYQREWLGRWVRDEGALVYPYEGGKNAMNEELPPGDYIYALGIDVGVVNSTAFVVAACRKGHPEVYILEAWKRTGLIPSAVAAHVERLRKQYGIGMVVVDEDGLGRGYAEEMRQSYGIGCQPAEKLRKRAFQELVAGDMKAGMVRINPTTARDLVDEIQILQWAADHAAEDPRFENHAADAFLYVVRALRPWYRPELEPPKPGTPEHYEAERKRERALAQERARQASKRSWRSRAGTEHPSDFLRAA